MWATGFRNSRFDSRTECANVTWAESLVERGRFQECWPFQNDPGSRRAMRERMLALHHPRSAARNSSPPDSRPEKRARPMGSALPDLFSSVKTLVAPAATQIKKDHSTITIHRNQVSACLVQAVWACCRKTSMLRAHSRSGSCIGIAHLDRAIVAWH